MTHLRRVLLASLGVLVMLGAAGIFAVPVRAADPMRVVLLIDSSVNMASMLTEFRAGLHAFFDGIPDGVEVALISTGGQIRIRVAPTTDRQLLHAAAARFSSDGGANSFLETMLESDRRFLRSAPNRRPIFVIVSTDPPTRDEPPIYQYNDFMQDFVRRRGRAHAVVIRGSQVGLATEILDNLTKNTDGLFAVMAVGNSLPDRMREIAEQVSAQE